MRLCALFFGLLVAGTANAQINFPSLQGRPLADCGDPNGWPDLCRVRQEISPLDAEARLAGKDTVWWRDGDTFTVVARRTSDGQSLCCEIAAPMARIPGTPLWVLTVKSPDLDEAVIDIEVAGRTSGFPTEYETDVAISTGVMQLTRRPVWRGPRTADGPAFESGPLKGSFHVETFASSKLGELRQVAVYLPPSFKRDHRYPVLYAADGRYITYFARVIEPLIVAGKLKPIMVVAPFAASGDRRGQEYVNGFRDDGEMLRKYDSFLTEELLPWAERIFGASRSAGDRVFYGNSFGGTWALDTALRHPGLAGSVISFSPCWRETGNGIEKGDKLRLFLHVGLFEGACTGGVRSLAERARAAGLADVRFEARASGHSIHGWERVLPEALIWAFGAK